MGSNSEAKVESPALVLDAELLYAGVPFVGMIFQQVAHITVPSTLAEVVRSHDLTGLLVLAREDGEQVTFFVGGSQPAAPAPAPPDEIIMRQRLEFSLQRETALQTDLASAREELYRTRGDHIQELASLHERKRQAEEQAAEKMRAIQQELLIATHGENQLIPQLIDAAEEMLPTIVGYFDRRSSIASNNQGSAALEGASEKTSSEPSTMTARSSQKTPEALAQWVVNMVGEQMQNPDADDRAKALDQIASTVVAEREDRGLELTAGHGGQIVYHLCRHAISLGLEASQVVAVFEPVLQIFSQKLKRYSRKKGKWLAKNLFLTADIAIESQEDKDILTFAGKVFEAARKSMKSAA